MSDELVSVDELLSARKDFVKSGDILVKASRAASSWDPEQRSMRFVMSAEVEDRDRDIVYQSGLTIDEFLKNPVGFFNHRSYGRPHGTWSDVERVLQGRPKRTEGTFTVAPEGVNPDADALALDMGAGLIRACSIGFRPKAVKKRETPEDKKDAPYYWPGYEILEAELLECSPCTIPANPAALAKAAAGGNVIARELIEEVLDNWAKDPATGLLMKRSDVEQAHKDGAGNRTSILLSATVKGTPEFTAFVEAAKRVGEAVHELSAAAENLAADDHQETFQEEASQDDASADKAAEDAEEQEIPGEYSADAEDQKTPEEETAQDDASTSQAAGTDIPEIIDAKDPELTQPQARSFLRKILDIAFGSETEPKIEQDLRARRQQAAEEAAAIASRRKALEQRFQSFEARLEGKGLV